MVYSSDLLAAHRQPRRCLPGPVTAAYYLCHLNLVSGVTFVRFLRGKKKVIWQPRT